MVAIVDTPLAKLLEAVEKAGVDLDSLSIILVEAELSDSESGDPHPDPQRGLDIALAYASRGKPIIVVVEREYGDLDVWHSLFLNPNVAFCPKPITSEGFNRALKKIMPEANI